MKRIFIFILLLISLPCYSKQLHSYADVKSSALNGGRIRLVVDYTRCSPSYKPTTLPNTAAIYTPNAMAIDTEGNIGFYLLYFTMNDPHYPLKSIYQYVRFAISNNNDVTLDMTTLNPVDYTLLKGHDVLNCKIDNGVTIFTSS